MAVTFVLDFSDGQHLETSGNGVIGRNPAVHTPGTEMEDPGACRARRRSRTTPSRCRAPTSRSASTTGVFWVMDLGSANGTTITYPGDGTFACDPNTRHEVDPGSVVRFGSASFALSRALAAGEEREGYATALAAARSSKSSVLKRVGEDDLVDHALALGVVPVHRVELRAVDVLELARAWRSRRRGRSRPRWSRSRTGAASGCG